MTDTTADMVQCLFCGAGETTIQAKGRVWNGVKGYSDPQWFELSHWCKYDDPFLRSYMTMKHHTRNELIAEWNSRNKQ